jgi:opacity protein-like surface antigen
MHGLRPVLLAFVLGLAFAVPARADATLFIGANTTPANRTVKGFSIGGWEFEYADTTDELTAGAPSLQTGSGNLLLQLPVPIFGFQPYFTTGGGFYRETLASRSDTSFAPNIGGGVKISLVGPLKLRVDYRTFKLGSGALFTPAHRIYAGVNLGF